MDSQHYYNPYNGQPFWGVIWILLQRIWGYMTGSLEFANLVSDEVQILVLVGVACSSALVGTFLILRKMTMLANSLSHTILLGIVIAYLITHGSALAGVEGHSGINIQAMLIAALITGLATTFLTEFLTKVARLQEDASTGLVFTSLFALGIVLVTLLTRNAHIGTEVVMGNVDALQPEDCRLVFLILGLNFILFFVFFKEFKITTFDPALAKALGFSPIFFNYLLMMQVSATSIGAFRAVGVLMVLSFMTGPPLTARLLTHNLKHLLFLSMLLGCLASIIGVALARHYLSVYGIALSTGGLVVCVITSIYLLAMFSVSARRFFSKRKMVSKI